LASGPEGRWPERASLRGMSPSGAEPGPEGKGRQGGIFKALKYDGLVKSQKPGKMSC